MASLPRRALLAALLALGLAAPATGHAGRPAARGGAEQSEVGQGQGQGKVRGERGRGRAGKTARATRTGKPARVATAKLRGARLGGAPRHAEVQRDGQPAPKKIVGPNADPRKHLPRGAAGRIIIGVMGGAGKDTPAEVNASLRALGGAIADAGDVILTGACQGLPDEAVQGARARGGVALGISSYSSIEDHRAAGQPTDFDVLQLTTLPPAHRGQSRPNFMGREIDNIERSDAIIIAGGRFGTLGELAIALEERRPIGVLTGTGGITDVVKDVVAASARAGKPAGAPIIYDSDPVRLVQRLGAATRAHIASGAPRGPVGDK